MSAYGGLIKYDSTHVRMYLKVSAPTPRCVNSHRIKIKMVHVLCGLGGQLSAHGLHIKLAEG